MVKYIGIASRPLAFLVSSYLNTTSFCFILSVNIYLTIDTILFANAAMFPLFLEIDTIL